MKNPSIAVVGPGAIGTTVIASLYEAGRAPMLCGRSARDHLELIVDEKHIVVPGPVLTEPAAIDAPVELVFLAVKSTQIAQSAEWLRTLCDPDTVICVLQNGVEQKEKVSEQLPGFPTGQILPSVVWFPAQAQPDGSVWLRGKARLTVPDVPQARIIAETLENTRCAIELTTDFASVTWRKLMQNAVAGLMVLARQRAGIFRRADISQLAMSYLTECLEVARAEGATLGDEVPDEILAAFQAYPTDMGTSILADREANRPLEWDIRNGVVQRLGRAHSIATPVSDVVVPLLAAASDWLDE